MCVLCCIASALGVLRYSIEFVYKMCYFVKPVDGLSREFGWSVPRWSKLSVDYRELRCSSKEHWDGRYTLRIVIKCIINQVLFPPNIALLVCSISASSGGTHLSTDCLILASEKPAVLIRMLKWTFLTSCYHVSDTTSASLFKLRHSDPDIEPDCTQTSTLQ